jgi:hypothetical protein
MKTEKESSIRNVVILDGRQEDVYCTELRVIASKIIWLREWKLDEIVYELPYC